VNGILGKINELDKSSDSPHETGRSCTSNNGNNGALDFTVLSPGHLLNMGYTGCKVAYADMLVHRLVTSVEFPSSNDLFAPL